MMTLLRCFMRHPQDGLLVAWATRGYDPGVKIHPPGWRRLAALLILVLVMLVSTERPARAVWADGADLIYRTAHTLDEGEFEVGIFSPLQYGISDQIQIALHPILLLVLTPHAAIRWRVTPEGPFTVSLDLDATWSFLDEVDVDGYRVEDPGACQGCGYPGSVQLTTTLTWQFTEELTWSFGGGAGMDILDVEPQLGILELHTSLLWRIDNENLLMAHGNINLHPWHEAPTSREYFQILYAHAWGFIHLGVGVAFGDFMFVESGSTIRSLPGNSGSKVLYEGKTHALPVYPILDVWIRL